MKRFGSIDSVDKRLRKLEFNLPRLDGQVKLLTNIHLSGTTFFSQAKAAIGSREKDHDTSFASQHKILGVCASCTEYLAYRQDLFPAILVNGPTKHGRNFVLKAAVTTFIGRF